jgi:hypothetical protein
MGKNLNIWLNDDDLELLNVLCETLKTSQGGALKLALKHVANDHMHPNPHGETEAAETEAAGSGLVIEIPPYVKLKSMLRQCQKEVREEVEKAKAQKLAQKAMMDKLLGVKP